MADLIRGRSLSPVEAVAAALDRIERVQPALNPFCFLYDEEARAAARAAEDAVLRGAPLGPLHGVPIALKDFTPTKGKTTTRGSRLLEHWVPDEDPVIVRRLHAAGAILIGKTTTPEFAFSSFTRSPLWGQTRNPWDPGRTSGGSSGGSAAAVASGCVALAEGTDMGGSVRIPAALCGIVGLKPSLGRIPMDILPTCFDSISHFGPLARTVDDAALFLSVTEGPDDADIQSQISPRALPRDLPHDLHRGVAGLRLALSPDLGFYRVDPEVAANLRSTAAALEAAGARIEPVELDWRAEIVDAWYDTWAVFLAATVAEYFPARQHDMDPELVALVERGLRIDAVTFKRLEEVRSRQWRSLSTLFERHDALLCPTMALPAPPIDASEADYAALDAEGHLCGLDMTSPFNNVSACPALSVPSGWTAAGLPTALQIVGRRFDDPTVLRIGAAVEDLRPWSAHKAPLWA